MYIEIILLVGFSMVITLLADLVPKDRELADVWTLFAIVLVMLVVITLAIFFILDWLL